MMKEKINKLEIRTFKGDYIYKQWNGVFLYLAVDEEGINFKLEDLDLDYDDRIVNIRATVDEFEVYCLSKYNAESRLKK